MGRLVDRERDSAAAEDVRRWLSEQSFGRLRPLSVDLHREESAEGEEAWFFVVVLPDPDPNEGTWPVDELSDLDRGTRDRAIEAGVSWPWYVVFKPESDEQQEDEDEQMQLPQG